MSNGIAKGGPDTACTQPFLETDLKQSCQQIARRAERQKHTNSTPQNWSMGVQWPRDISKPKWQLRALLLRGTSPMPYQGCLNYQKVPVTPHFLSLQVATTME
jgi:hypothetical protein